MSSDDKPTSTTPSTTPPPSGKGDPDQSSPSLEELDSAWEGEEQFDEDATMVAKIPLDLVALSRRGNELESKPKLEPERHEAITARPPPLAGEASVVIDAPHETLPRTEASSEEEEEDDEDDLAADDLDGGWDIEEERAAAADVAAGLDPEARRKAAEARAAQRKEKSRAKKLAAKEKRKARADSIRLKQKKPKKRSTFPPPAKARESVPAPARSTPPKATARNVAPASPARETPTVPPKEARSVAVRRPPMSDLNRMVLFVAVVVVIGALLIGLSRR